MCQIFVHRLKSSNFIIESKMAELNQKKKIQNSQINQIQCENFILPWKKMNTTIHETFCTCSTESMFLRYKQISKKAVNLGSFFNVQCIYFLEASKKLI